MIKKALFLCFALMMLHQVASAQEMLLTIESDKSAYPWNGYAHFKVTLKNLSEDIVYKQGGKIEYFITIERYGAQVWEWSEVKSSGG